VSPSTAAAVGPILNIAASALTEQLVDDYHAAGVQVYAWTLDTPGQWAPIRTWGIDRYVTNRAVDYRAWRDWVCSGEVWR
jgi:glycerophosphoryl diester phosphodiesterase